MRRCCKGSCNKGGDYGLAAMINDRGGCERRRGAGTVGRARPSERSRARRRGRRRSEGGRRGADHRGHWRREGLSQLVGLRGGESLYNVVTTKGGGFLGPRAWLPRPWRPVSLLAVPLPGRSPPWPYPSWPYSLSPWVPAIWAGQEGILPEQFCGDCFLADRGGPSLFNKRLGGRRVLGGQGELRLLFRRPVMIIGVAATRCS